MLLLDSTNAPDYLRSVGLIGSQESVTVRELSGGVSNAVWLVERAAAAGESFVLKQARPQLRVPQPWFCAVERMLREIDVMRVVAPLVEQLGDWLESHASATTVRPHTPRILWEDRQNFALAMSAAPFPHLTWKERLLAADIDDQFGATTGHLLGWLHARTWLDDSIATAFDDRTFFEDLRIDPYYRQVARVRPELAGPLGQLIDEVATHRRCLVHGDFSPKNLLTWERHLMLIDFEVGHFGDPAFDLGFFLTHLVLKSFHHGRTTSAGRRMQELTHHFWSAYERQLADHIGRSEWTALQRRATFNLAGCLLARVDGKSRVDYLRDPQPVREFAEKLLCELPTEWNEVWACVE